MGYRRSPAAFQWHVCFCGVGSQRAAAPFGSGPFRRETPVLRLDGTNLSVWFGIKSACCPSRIQRRGEPRRSCPLSPVQLHSSSLQYLSRDQEAAPSNKADAHPLEYALYALAEFLLVGRRSCQARLRGTIRRFRK